MNSRDFVYWLQGYFELAGTTDLSPEKCAVIRKHLNLVFAHEIDPSVGSVHHQEGLDAIHAGGELKLSADLEKRFNDLREELKESIMKQRPNRPEGGLVRC